MPSLVTTGAAIVYATLFVVCFIGVSAGIGRRLLRLLSIADSGPYGERIVVAILAGAGALQFVPLALGAAGMLSVSSLRAALAVVSVASLADLWSELRAARRAAQNRDRVPQWLSVWLVALMPGLVVAWLLAITPTIDSDGLGYHLTVPKRWLLGGGSLSYLPTYPYSNTPMGVEMLFMNGMAVAGDTAAKMVHFSLGLVGAFALYLAGKRLAGRMVGAVAVTAYLFGPMGVGALLGWAYLEGVTSAALIGSGLAWLIWYRERDRAWLRAAVLLAGFGVSFKMTAGLFPVALGGLTLLILGQEARARREPMMPQLIAVARLLPLLVVPVAPWLVRSAIVTGNPVFPMGAQFIVSRDFSAALAAKFESYNRYMVWGGHLSWSLARRKLFFDAIALLLAAVGAVVAWRQRSAVRRSTALVILGCLLVQLAAVGLYRRYWIPVFSVFELPMIALFASSLSTRWAQRALVAIAALASLIQARTSLQSVQYDVSGLIKTALGLESQRTFLSAHLTLFPLYERANREQPRPGGVTMSQYCGGFYLEAPTYCADIVQEALRYDSWPVFVSDMQRLRVTHVIAPREWSEVGSVPMMEGGNVSMLVRQSEHDCVGKLLRDNARLIAAAGDQGLYSVDSAALGGAR